MADKGMLMSPMMVKQTLLGKKHCTRRLMNPQPPEWIDTMGFDCFTKAMGRYACGRGYCTGEFEGKIVTRGYGEKFFKVPYFNGDYVYFKERHKILSVKDGVAVVQYSDDSIEQCHYKPDSVINYIPDKMRSSLFMHKWASRVWKEIKNVRVERLWDITDEDAMDEGMDETVASYLGISMMDYTKDGGQYYRRIYKAYWNFLNGEHSWGKNEWVVRYGFKEIEVK